MPDSSGYTPLFGGAPAAPSTPDDPNYKPLFGAPSTPATPAPAPEPAQAAQVPASAPEDTSGYKSLFSASGGAQEPTAPVSKKGSFLGGLGRIAGNAVSDLKSLNNPDNLGKLAMSAIHTVTTPASMLGHELAGDKTGGIAPRQPGESFTSYLGRAAPLIGGAAAGAQQVGEGVAGAAQGAAIIGAKAKLAVTGHGDQATPSPLGEGFVRKTAATFEDHPINTFVNYLATIAGGAGATGRVADEVAARAAEGSGLATGAANVSKAASGIQESAAQASGQLTPVTAKLPSMVTQRLGPALAKTHLGAALQARLESNKVTSDAAQQVKDLTTENVKVPKLDMQRTLDNEVAALRKIGVTDSDAAVGVHLAHGLVDGEITRPDGTKTTVAEAISNALADPVQRPALEQTVTDYNKQLPANHDPANEMSMQSLELAAGHRLGTLSSDQMTRLDAAEMFTRGLGEQHGEFSGKGGPVDPTEEPTSPDTAPAEMRPALQRRADLAGQYEKLHDEELAKGTPEGKANAARLQTVQADMEQMSKLSSFGQGVRQPTYVQGGLPRPRPTFLDKLSGTAAVKAKTLAYEKKKTSDLAPFKLEDQAANQMKDHNAFLSHKLTQAVQDQHGVTPESVGVDPTQSKAALMRQMADARQPGQTDDNGFVPWDSKRGTLHSAQAINDGTVWLHAPIANALDSSLRPLQDRGIVHDTAKAAFRGVASATYTGYLRKSPTFAAHRIGANALVMATKANMPLTEQIHYGIEAGKKLLSGDIPGSVLDQTRKPGAVHALGNLPSVVNDLTRAAMYLKHIGSGATSEVAARQALDALSKANDLPKGEMSTLHTIFPMAPWIKTMSGMIRKLGEDHPVGTLFTMNAGVQAAQRNEKGLPWYLQAFNPLGIYSVAGNLGGAVHPLIRAGFAGAGINLSRRGAITTSAKEKANGGPSLAGRAYAMAHQLPATKIVDSGLTSLGLRAPVQRTDTGAARFNRDGTPMKINPSLTPYWESYLGRTPSTYVPTAAQSRLAAKSAKTNAKRAKTETRHDSALAKKYPLG